MARFGLVGGSYASQSPAVNAESTVNWYPEVIESPGKSSAVLYPTPGTKSFASIDSPVRGVFTFGDRTFAVGGGKVYEVFSNGTVNNFATVANDGKAVTWAGNQANQIALASGGQLLIIDITGPTASSPGLLSSVLQVGFSDTYFIALLDDGRFQISNPLDGTVWPGAQVVRPSRINDNAISMIVDHNEVWLWSGTRGIGYYDSGSSSIFDPIGASAFMETGAVSTFGVVRADNTFFWIDASERGGGVARRANGITPARISNHAVEYQWSKYPKLTDAVAWSYEDQGHVFVCWYFPSARGGLGATWCYDVATQMWHERTKWDSNQGSMAHPSLCHTYNKSWGKHLVGDWNSGTIYEMSINYYDDDGSAIRRERIAPPIAMENQWIRHNQLQVDIEAGLGLEVGQGSNSQMTLSWSDDGGHTYSDERFGSAGREGQYKTRLIWRRLGMARQRTYKITCTDPIPWRVIEGDLIAPPWGGLSERLPKQYQKVS